MADKLLSEVRYENEDYKIFDANAARSTHSHDWTSITDKPSTFTPATHSHNWTSITDKPSTFTPATHTHSWASITDKPFNLETAMRYGYERINTNGTRLNNSSDMQANVPWTATENGNKYFPLAGLCPNYINTAYNVFESFSYEGSSGTAAKQKMYGIKVKKDGFYLVSYSVTVRSANAAGNAIHVLRTNGTNITGILDDYSFTSLIPCNTNTSYHQTISRTGLTELVSGDTLMLGCGQRKGDGVADIYFYHGCHNLTVTLLQAV